MRKFLLMSCVGAAALLANGAAFANDELIQLSKDPKQWALPTGDYANHRFSKLDQINSDNVKRLTPVWSFSTGVLRVTRGALGNRQRHVFQHAVPEHCIRARFES